MKAVNVDLQKAMEALEIMLNENDPEKIINIIRKYKQESAKEKDSVYNIESLILNKKEKICS